MCDREEETAGRLGVICNDGAQLSLRQASSITRVLNRSQTQPKSGEKDAGVVDAGESVGASCDASELLEPSENALDEVSAG